MAVPHLSCHFSHICAVIERPSDLLGGAPFTVRPMLVLLLRASRQQRAPCDPQRRLAARPPPSTEAPFSFGRFPAATHATCNGDWPQGSARPKPFSFGRFPRQRTRPATAIGRKASPTRPKPVLFRPASPRQRTRPATAIGRKASPTRPKPVLFRPASPRRRARPATVIGRKAPLDRSRSLAARFPAATHATCNGDWPQGQPHSTEARSLSARFPAVTVATCNGDWPQGQPHSTEALLLRAAPR